MKASGAQVVLIAGAATSIGRSIAESFAGEGAQLVLTDVVEHHLAEVVDSIALRTGRRPERRLLRVTDPEAWHAAVEDTETKFGRIDVIVNAAEFEPAMPWRDAAADDWSRAIGINLMGVVSGFDAILPALERAAGSLIVVACEPEPASQRVVGASARSAALTFARAVRRDLAPAVTVVTAAVRDGCARIAGDRILAGVRAGEVEITVDTAGM